MKNEPEQPAAGISVPSPSRRKSKFKKQYQFLREFVYAGLPDLNTGFDSPLICHFRPEDFLTVIDRCEHHHVSIYGIEVFSTDVELPHRAAIVDYNIPIPLKDGYDWARQFVRQYEGEFDKTICASFGIAGFRQYASP